MKNCSIALSIVLITSGWLSMRSQVIDFNPSKWLIPQPQHIEIESKKIKLREGRIVVLNNPDLSHRLYQSVLKLRDEIAPWAGVREISMSLAEKEIPAVQLKVDTQMIEKAQGYSISINAGQINVIAHDQAGLYYAIATLNQLAVFASEAGYLPSLEITDFPDFKRRGIMLDISRDKVPTMQSLFKLVDQMTSWKMNELQLYTEHTFAYQNHEIVWKHASPMTAAQVLELDHYCKERFVELVPNQNSFGHMHRWLEHKEYTNLSECPNGCETPWGLRAKKSLSPAEPGSLELMEELYAELLPHFSSNYFNIGCDETVELGNGKSKALIEKHGKGRVYLDFLKKLNELANKHGKKTMFWSDIILRYPKLIPELPKDITAMVWGYGVFHPFDEQGAQFKESEIPFYVCPGTSAWQTIIGRYRDTAPNQLNAAENGKKHGAKGYLLTDWGDHGHWQPLPVSYPGYIYGAGVSWAVEANSQVDVPKLLDIHLFKDKNHIMGKLVKDIGSVYNDRNTVPVYFDILHTVHPGSVSKVNRTYKKEDLMEYISSIDKAIEPLSKADMRAEDAPLIEKEILNAAALAKFGCKLGVAQVTHGATIRQIAPIPLDERLKLADELEQIIYDFRNIWLERNRIGGLRESAGRMESILRELRKR